MTKEIRSPNVENSQLWVAGFVLRISSFVIRICEEWFRESKPILPAVSWCAISRSRRRDIPSMSRRRLRLQVAPLFLCNEMIHRKAAPAIDENQHQQKQDQRGKLEVLALLEKHHLRHPPIEDRADQDT